MHFLLIDNEKAVTFFCDKPGSKEVYETQVFTIFEY